MEIWKDITGYEGIYQVSNLGNIRNNKSKKILKDRFRKDYKCVVLYKNKIGKCFSVHRIVAIEFLENLNNHEFVNHINKNKNDNRICNLEWVNIRENISHLYNKNFPTGVSIKKNSNRYVAQIYINGKKHHLGYFSNPNDASEAYKKRLKLENLTNKYS